MFQFSTFFGGTLNTKQLQTLTADEKTLQLGQRFLADDAKRHQRGAIISSPAAISSGATKSYNLHVSTTTPLQLIDSMFHYFLRNTFKFSSYHIPKKNLWPQRGRKHSWGTCTLLPSHCQVALIIGQKLCSEINSWAASCNADTLQSTLQIIHMFLVGFRYLKPVDFTSFPG